MLVPPTNQNRRLFISAINAICSDSGDEAMDRGQRGEAAAYGSNCNVKLTALHRLKPSSNAKSHEGSITAWLRSSLCSQQPSAYVRSRRGAMNPHTTRIMNAPTI